MEIQEIKELMAQFDTSSLREFEVTKGDASLYMSKNKQNHLYSESTNHGPVMSSVTETVAPEKAIEVTTEPVTVSTTTESEMISSPLVGVVYLQPSPTEAAFKSVGDTVKKGEVVCIVEAMKLMNEITSTVDGVIAEILVENEAVVEYGQPLFSVSV